MEKRVLSVCLILVAFAAVLLPALSSEAQTPPRPGPRKFDGREEEEKPDEFGGNAEKAGDKAPAADSDKPVLAKEVVKERMETAMGPVRKCYEDALKTDAKAAGRIVVSFKIQLDGSVTDAVVKESNFVGGKAETKGAVEQCVLKRVAEIRFPKRSKGKPQNINFPFNLKPKTAG